MTLPHEGDYDERGMSPAAGCEHCWHVESWGPLLETNRRHIEERCCWCGEFRSYLRELIPGDPGHTHGPFVP